MTDSNQTEKKIKIDYSNLRKSALYLPTEYDSCILGIKEGLLVYDEKLVLEVIYQECLQSILNGVFEIDKNYDSISDQAYLMAVEMFDYNYDCYVENGPLFK